MQLQILLAAVQFVNLKTFVAQMHFWQYLHLLFPALVHSQLYIVSSHLPVQFLCLLAEDSPLLLSQLFELLILLQLCYKHVEMFAQFTSRWLLWSKRCLTHTNLIPVQLNVSSMEGSHVLGPLLIVAPGSLHLSQLFPTIC